MKAKEFRAELKKNMPGYKWTVQHQGTFDKITLSATGIQTSGYNRISTLCVTRREKEGAAYKSVEYEVKSAGFGLAAPFLGEYTDGTLARALRGLQDFYEIKAADYSNHAASLEFARRV